MSDTKIGTVRRTVYVVRWAAIVTTLTALVVGVVIGMGVQFRIDHPTNQTIIIEETS